MTHHQHRSGDERLEGLLAELGAPRPAFAEGELLSGFRAVGEQLRRLGAAEAALVDAATDRAEIGSDAYALGIEFSRREDWEQAARWLELAARSGVADAAYELQTLDRRRALNNLAGVSAAGSDTWQAPATRLARLRRSFSRLHEAESLAHTLKAVAEGAVNDLDYGACCLNLVRPDGDLVVASVSGSETAESFLAGRVGPRAAWDARLSMGERWGEVAYISHEIGWTTDGDGVPSWRSEGGPDPAPGRWHNEDRLFAEMRTSDGALLGVLSVDLPQDGLLPGPWEREALQLYAREAALAITTARLRADAQRALVRLEREHTLLQVGEDRLRQTMAIAQRPMALAELPAGRPSRLLKVNDALCRLLDRSPNALLEFSLEDLVHPDDLAAWLRISQARGSCTARLTRRDGSYLPTTISAVPVTGDSSRGSDGPRCLITLDEDGRAGRSSGAPVLTCDPLTGAVTGAALRAELQRLCDTPATDGRATSVAVLSVGLDDFTLINTNHGQEVGDAVLVEVARRLTDLARRGDVVARLGGDEFALLAIGRTFQQIEELEPRIRASLTHPIRISGTTLHLSASVGIMWARNGMTAEQIINTADQDMYFAKTLRKTAQLSHTT
ncbi:diguanylate cyclase domain-containing protein [Streptomyces sp. NPDC002680]|uniref:GGDEF domain-containing protein n=1 Tax=Streptomyces sp. NPDC002680 TaxID=3364659 RepID=UPI003695A84D